MPGTRITDKQVNDYMENIEKGMPKKTAALKAGISESSGRNIAHARRNKKRKQREGKPTREDRFETVMKSFVVPLLERGITVASHIFDMLQEEYPGEFDEAQKRTFRRRIEKYKLIEGKGKEIMFPQEKPQPGKSGISDFTLIKFKDRKMKVTIAGEPFEHKIFHYRLQFSGYRFVDVSKGTGERFVVMSKGLQDAWHDLGGVPEEHRTDNLSLVYKNRVDGAQEDLTLRMNALYTHYGVRPTRNNAGKGHENGAIESSHRHFKDRLKSELIKRDSLNFDSFEQYRAFVKGLAAKLNLKNASKIAVERAHLRALPEGRAIEYDDVTAVVPSSSVIVVRRVMYSVPNKLIGQVLKIKLYDDKLECYLGAIHVITLTRMPIPPKGKRAHNIDYRHIIEWLAKKPGAFPGYAYRDYLLPTESYRKVWEYVKSTMNLREAARFIVGILYLAYTQNCEEELSIEILDRIEHGSELKLSSLQSMFKPQATKVPDVVIPEIHINRFNELIPGFKGQE